MFCIYKDIMKPAPLLLFLPLLFPVHALAARPLTKPELRADGRYEFREHGRPVKYRIATDELQESGNGVDKRINLSSKDHVRKLQQAAKDLGEGHRKYDLVAYREGEPPTERNRRIVTNRVGVTLEDGIDPTSIGLAIQAKGMKAVDYLPGDYILEFADAAEAITASEALANVPGVHRANLLLGQKRVQAFIPTDPFFYNNTTPANNPNTGAYYGYSTSITDDFAELKAIRSPVVLYGVAETRGFQWYLNRLSDAPPGATAIRNQVPLVFWSNYKEKDIPSFVDPDYNIYPARFGNFEYIRPSGARTDPPPNGERAFPTYFENPVDVNVIPAWDLTTGGDSPSLINGTGVKVGIIDDGVQLNHRDLESLNILVNDDRNFLDGDQSPTSVDQKRLDPTPPIGQNHGTAVAGLILAARNNAAGGITGVAPDAKLAAYRVIGLFADDAIVSDAMVWGGARVAPQPATTDPFLLSMASRRGAVKFDISCNPWGFSNNGRDLIPLDLYARKAMAFGVDEGRAGRGVIFIFPAGNDGENHGNTNYTGSSNSIYALTVGAVSDLGRRVAYSPPGASLHVVAPSGGVEMPGRIQDAAGKLLPLVIPPIRPDTGPQRANAYGYALTPDEWDAPTARYRNTQQIVTLNTPNTTTGSAGYNNNFSGTSASCALATGVVALMLEANPNLGWRDVQEIMMRSAKVVDPMMGEWQYNHMGMPMSHNYGAGVVDATHAVRLAQVWQNLGPRFGSVVSNKNTYDYNEVKGLSKKSASNQLIPDNIAATASVPNGAKNVRNFTIDAPDPDLRIEQIVVRLRIAHGRRGDLGIILTSPKSGQSDTDVESYLMVPHRDDYNANIGQLIDPRTGLAHTDSDNDVRDGEYYDFTTVRHWGTSTQNTALTPGSSTSGGAWTLTVWDNTNKGTTGANSATAALPEDRVFCPVPNPSSAGEDAARVKYIEVMYHGTKTPSTNEPPVIISSKMIGKTGKPFQTKVKASTDLSAGPGGRPRAPIYDYQIRVINTLTGNNDLIIGPTTAQQYVDLYPNEPAPVPKLSPVHLRFDRTTGELTSVPYPATDPILIGSSDWLFDPTPTGPVWLPFTPLPKGSWLVEVKATSIFGTTRVQMPLTIRDTLTYEEFKSLYFTPAELLNPLISGDRADPDFDGVPNLLEYGMGGDPRVFEPSLAPRQQVVGNNLIYTYQVDTSTSGYTITPQVSNTLVPLASWTATTSTVVSSDGAIDTRQVTLPIVPGSPQFIRLRIAQGTVGP
jgi:subtilisin family serine protease